MISFDHDIYTLCTPSGKPRSMMDIVAAHTTIHSASRYPYPGAISTFLESDSSLQSIQTWAFVFHVRFEGFETIDLSVFKQRYPKIDTVVFADCWFKTDSPMHIKSIDGLTFVCHQCKFGSSEFYIYHCANSAVILSNPLPQDSEHPHILVSAEGNPDTKIYIADCDEANIVHAIGASKVFVRGRLPRNDLLVYQCSDMVQFTDCTVVSNIMPRIYSCFNTNINLNNCKFPNIEFLIDRCYSSVDIRDTDVKVLSFHDSSVALYKSGDCGENRIINALSSICRYYSDESDHQNTVVTSSKSAGFPRSQLTLYKKALLYRRKLFGTPVADLSECLGSVLVRLEVPPTADVIYDIGMGKYRVSEAKVVGFYRIHNWPLLPRKTCLGFREFVVSNFNKAFEYKKNAIVTPEHPFEYGPEACASGIHGFASTKDAMEYNF